MPKGPHLKKARTKVIFALAPFFTLIKLQLANHFVLGVQSIPVWLYD